MEKNQHAVEMGRLGGSRKHPGKGFGSRAVQDKALATRKIRAEERKIKKSLQDA